MNGRSSHEVVFEDVDDLAHPLVPRLANSFLEVVDHSDLSPEPLFIPLDHLLRPLDLSVETSFDLLKGFFLRHSETPRVIVVF